MVQDIRHFCPELSKQDGHKAAKNSFNEEIWTQGLFETKLYVIIRHKMQKNENRKFGHKALLIWCNDTIFKYCL